MQALRTNGAASDILWSMATGVFESVRDPELIDPGLLDSVMTLLRRAEYLGLLKSDADRRPDESWSWLPAVVAGMTERGLPAGGRWRQLDRTADWQRLTHGDTGNRDDGNPTAKLAGALLGAVEQINDQLEMSPQPDGEWAPVIGTLGEDLLAELIGVSVSSVRRYASGSRLTPQVVAERLHFLALLIADLAGSYNDFGIRRWLNRPRTPLGGRTPASLLGEFDPEGTNATAIAKLAASLIGAGSA